MKVKGVYQFFWGVAIICALLGCINSISGEGSVIDINVHDTYFVVAYAHLYGFFALFYFVTGLTYMLCRPLKLIKVLTGIHTIITIAGFVAYFILLGIVKQMHDPHSLFDSTQETQNIGIVIILFLVALVQPLFLANITAGLVRKIKMEIVK